MTIGEAAHAEARPRALRVGFLHLGRANSGLRRYGRILAGEAALRADLAVLEADAGERDGSLAELRRAAGVLRSADVVHVQWKVADWGVRSGGLPRTEAFVRTLGRPLVVTLHDVRPRTGRRERWLDPAALGTRRLGRLAQRLVVHNGEERRRLEGLVPLDRLRVVPHFVEARAGLPDREAARRALDLEGRRVMTLLGHITRGKGHALVIEALRQLPGDVVAVFVGSVIEGRDHVRGGLEEQAAASGVADRVRFTGFLPEGELERVMAATDVAVCPFRVVSTSGALATWIGSGRPIVCSDLPAFRELAAMEPGSLRLFAPYEAGALAAAVTTALEAGGGRSDPLVGRLAERLATPRIVELYAAVYREALGTAAR